MFLCSTLL